MLASNICPKDVADCPPDMNSYKHHQFALWPKHSVYMNSKLNSVVTEHNSVATELCSVAHTPDQREQNMLLCPVATDHLSMAVDRWSLGISTKRSLIKG